MSDKMHPKKCTVFPFHPWASKEGTKCGLVMWIPHSIEELIKTASEQLKFPHGSCILSEDGGKILEVDMISDGQKLYLVNETNLMSLPCISFKTHVAFLSLGISHFVFLGGENHSLWDFVYEVHSSQDSNPLVGKFR